MSEVTLHDGRAVDSASEDWRAECEARHVLSLRRKADRHTYIDRVADKRGEPAKEGLIALVYALWNANKAVQDDGAK